MEEKANKIRKSNLTGSAIRESRGKNNRI